MARASLRHPSAILLAALALPLFASRAEAHGPPAAVAEGLPESAVEVPGEIAVDLDDDLAPADVARLEAAYGLHPNSALSNASDRIELADVPVDAEEAVLAALAREPGVVHAERMEVYRASFVPDDPLYKEQWHLTRVGAETAWEYGCGRGVTVAVVDTGVACFDKGPFSRGTDLAGTRCEGGYDFVGDSPEASDDQGHGTHVAGTIAQTTNNGRGTAGLAFCATLMPVKVLSKAGWGTLADVAEGIRFAADHGAQIINLSLGGPSRSRIIEDAVRHAIDRGALVVAAAGNSGRSVGYPAAYEGVLAVSATDSNDTIAWFSSRGPQVGIAAPGVGVTQQTVCQAGRNKCEIFGTFSGTSMASPHVAGSAALVMGLGVTDPDAARSALVGTARAERTASAGRSPELYGAGIVDAASAVRASFVRRMALRVGVLFAVLLWIWRRIRGRRGVMAFTAGAGVGALLGGVGLLPVLPWITALSPLGRLGRWRWLGELATRPFGEWDVGWSVGWHRFLPLANAVPVLVGMGVFFGMKRLRPALGGFAAGMTALLLQLALSLDVATPFGATATRVWLVANAAVCLWLARVAFERETARS
jgi:serine protease